MSTKQYAYQGFKNIEVGAAFEVEAVRGETFSVSVNADDFTHIRVEMAGDTLHIGRQGIEWFAPLRQQPVARVTLPDLKGITLSGATRGTIANFQGGENLEVKVTGASHLEMVGIQTGAFTAEVTGASTLKGSLKTTGNARFEVNGASKADVTGAAADTSVNLSGASRCDLLNFTVHNAALKISGASNGWVNLNGRMDAEVSGASNLTWTGNPTMGDISTSGASNLHRK